MSGQGEDKVTSWFAQQSRAREERFPIGIGDDMAQVNMGGGSVLVTTDMLLDGVHFDLASAGAEQVGYKAMAASLSDCAAMATRPVCAVVAVALPTGFGEDKLKELHAGIVRAGDMFDCTLIGGDITAWRDNAGRFVINVTMLSECVDCVEPVKRSGAKVGDAVCVTGELGGSIAGKHLTFVPRVEEAIEIARAADVHAMMDVTDGLVKDLSRICAASGVGAIIEAERVPMTHAAKEGNDPLEAALYDGEDFELLFTVSAEDYETLAGEQSIKAGITRVGLITDSGRIELQRGRDREVLDVKGYDHL
ncbi:Thiamine-monophosphate kinase [Anaerohalosphaera lusitana]|uniref:Thiamine-monophosphate kinase n=1 Tax=Anaerohalosphaera lusitana TaxID=1936003 RepID=A0A1U9NLR9_9BACT|nr:thiamine-phosphate kinase [Anaerohalosphaera lusitana]AQT68892.1 Thiamine-monophosphate kinase [Anaerohalosphaera lusitana]